MKKFIKSRLVLQIVLASLVATLATAGIVAAATTIGDDITTTGDLTVNTDDFVVDADGDITMAPTGGGVGITGTLTVSGLTTLGNASSTGWIKAANITSDTGAISFGDENLTTTGTLSTGATTLSSLVLNSKTLILNEAITFNATTTTSGHIMVADADDEWINVAMGGDATIDNTGALTIGAGVVENSMLANATSTFTITAATSTVLSDVGDLEFFEFTAPAYMVVTGVQVYCSATAATASVEVKEAGTTIISSAVTPSAGAVATGTINDEDIASGAALTFHVTTNGSGTISNLIVTLVVKAVLVN